MFRTILDYTGLYWNVLHYIKTQKAAQKLKSMPPVLERMTRVGIHWKIPTLGPRDLPQHWFCIPRPSRLPLGFALGQSLGPRDAKSLLRQISWSSGDTSLGCTGLYWLVLGYTGQKWAVRDRTELYWYFYKILKRAEIHQKGPWKMWVTNFGKYPMTELGNPTQKSIGKCRIPILRNASQQKREIELKRAVINTDCQILRNT